MVRNRVLNTDINTIYLDPYFKHETYITIVCVFENLILKYLRNFIRIR